MIFLKVISKNLPILRNIDIFGDMGKVIFLIKKSKIRSFPWNIDIFGYMAKFDFLKVLSK